MNCLDAERLFDAYLDGELSGSLRLEFDAHRLRCALCQQKLALIEACEHVLARDARCPELSPDFTDRVMNDVGRRQVLTLQKRRRRLVIAGTIGLQAAAVLVFAVAWWGGRQSASQSTAVSATRTFAEEVGRAIDERNRIKLQDLIYTRADQLAAARSRLRDIENDLRGVARYATSLSVLGDLSGSPEARLPNPLELLLQLPAPPAAEDSEPAPDAAGSFSL